MTAPVINTMLESNSKMSFIIPNDYSIEDIPKPLINKLEITTIPERTIGVLVFSGNANRTKIKEKSQLLHKWLDSKNLLKIGELQLARYNPPFIPGPFRHNELWQTIEYTKKDI